MQRSEWGAPVILRKPVATRRAPLEELSDYSIAGVIVNSIRCLYSLYRAIDDAEVCQEFDQGQNQREILGSFS